MFFHYIKLIWFGYGKETVILATEQTGNKVTIVCLEQNGFLLVSRYCSKQRTRSTSCVMPRLDVWLLQIYTSVQRQPVYYSAQKLQLPSLSRKKNLRERTIFSKKEHLASNGAGKPRPRRTQQ